MTKSFEYNINQGLIESNINKLSIKIFELPTKFKITNSKAKQNYDTIVVSKFEKYFSISEFID